MPNASVFAQIEGFGECLVISVNAAGTFSVAKGPRPVGAIDIVPVTCDVVYGGVPEFIITRNFANGHSPTIRKRKPNEPALVPVIGRAEGFIREININASTGAITAGTASTTVATLFP